LVDPKGEVKLKRFTRVFKKIYTVNDGGDALRKLVESLKRLSEN